MPKNAAATEAPGEFPITAAEFVSGIKNSQAEMKRAFLSQMNSAGETGRKSKGEWATLYDLFRNKPIGTSWESWSATKNNEGE